MIEPTQVTGLSQHVGLLAGEGAELAVGFGLTVTEAMWKERPVAGSAVGGIVDQIIHGETGALGRA